MRLTLKMISPASVPGPAPQGALPPECATLDTLRPGDRCIVRAIEGAGQGRRRLLEMGFVAGTELRIVRIAPLGDPMQVTLRGYHLSLRRAEARTVRVDWL
ncbi:MAG: FeoA family protein [Planctomycetaceae bacterium]